MDTMPTTHRLLTGGGPHSRQQGICLFPPQTVGGRNAGGISGTSIPHLKQTVFRPGTILGENVSNQITNLCSKRKIVLGIKGAMNRPFRLSSGIRMWSTASKMAITQDKEGIYNLAGDGTLTMKQIARHL